MNLSKKPNAQQSKRQNALSERQQSDVERFHRIFPSEQDVLIYFSPAKWKAAIANANKCTCYSYMTLSMLNSTYSDGLAERLVENNMRGIYSMTRPIDSINDNAVRQAAGLFVGNSVQNYRFSVPYSISHSISPTIKTHTGSTT